MTKKLIQVFNKWDNYFKNLSLEDRNLIIYDNRTNKDELAHLCQWQRLAEARLKAAKKNTQPDLSFYPDWFDPLAGNDADDHINRFNDWIYLQNKNKEWDQLYAAWKTTFKDVISLSKQIPAEQLSKKRLFPWLGEFSLNDVLEGTLKHYQEHEKYF